MFDQLKYIIVIKYLIYNLKMNFSDYSIQEIQQLAGELAGFLGKYSEEKLKGFSEKEKIIIGTAALDHLSTIVHVTNINSGIMSFEGFLKSENLMIDFIREETKANKK